MRRNTYNHPSIFTRLFAPDEDYDKAHEDQQSHLPPGRARDGRHRETQRATGRVKKRQSADLAYAMLV